MLMPALVLAMIQVCRRIKCAGDGWGPLETELRCENVRRQKGQGGPPCRLPCPATRMLEVFGGPGFGGPVRTQMPNEPNVTAQLDPPDHHHHHHTTTKLE